MTQEQDTANPRWKGRRMPVLSSVCSNCFKQREEHAGGDSCLFAPTKFSPMELSHWIHWVETDGDAQAAQAFVQLEETR